MSLKKRSALVFDIAVALVGALALAAGQAKAAPIIGVDIDTGNGAPIFWTAYTLGDVNSTVLNLVAEDGSATTVDFLLSGVTGTQFFAVPASLVPSHPNPLDLVAGDILHSGPNPTIALWSGLVPGTLYNYWVFVSSSADDTITATGSTIDSFGSPTVSHLSQRINGIVGDSTLTFDSYARQVVSSATGTIQVEILSNGTPTPSGYAVQLVSQSQVPEPASLLLLGAGLAFLAVRRRFTNRA